MRVFAVRCHLLGTALFLLLCHPGAGPVPGAIEGDTWFPIGPAPLDHAQSPGCSTCGVNASGRATVVAANPFAPDDVWLGTSNGGVWHSVEAGEANSWKPLSDQEKSLAIGALVLDQCNGNGCATVYAGTGENSVRRDTYYGEGLLVGTVNAPFDVSWALKGESLFSLASFRAADPKSASDATPSSSSRARWLRIRRTISSLYIVCSPLWAFDYS